jgi:hypothetical protein
MLTPKLEQILEQTWKDLQEARYDFEDDAEPGDLRRVNRLITRIGDLIDDSQSEREELLEAVAAAGPDAPGPVVVPPPKRKTWGHE